MDGEAAYLNPIEARKDIAWWARLAQQHNGVSLMWLIKEPGTDTVIQTDICPKGYGVYKWSSVLQRKVPQETTKDITVLEMWTVMESLCPC